MKRIVRLLARLYPASWRKRYAVEFDALMEDSTPTLRDAVDVLWGAIRTQATNWTPAKITMAGALGGILAGAAIFFATPVHYLSQVVITLKPGDTSSLTLLADAQRKICNRDSLASIIQEHNLYRRERAHNSIDAAITKMQRSVTIFSLEPISNSKQQAVPFTLQFDYADPRIAQLVTSELVDRLLQSAVEERAAAPSIISAETFQVLDPPTLPRVPTNPTPFHLAVLGLFAGILTGITLAIMVKMRGPAQIC